MKAEIKAGALIEFATPSETREAVRAGMVDVYRDVNYLRRSGLVTVDGAGALAGEPVDFGPDVGFVWDVRRVSIFGLTVGQSVQLHIGRIDAAGFVGNILAADGFRTFNRGSVILKGYDLLKFGGSALTASAVLTVVVQASEVPAESAWRLL